jgi:hypothetical protein
LAFQVGIALFALMILAWLIPIEAGLGNLLPRSQQPRPQ